MGETPETTYDTNDEVLLDVTGAEHRGQRDPIETVTYGDLTLHLDAAGNVVRIDFGSGWDAW